MHQHRHKHHVIKHEFFEHLPSTMIGVAVGIALLWTIQASLHQQKSASVGLFENLFHFFHASHIFLSAITATAIFYRHQHQRLKTVMVVFPITLIFCGLSDALIPFMAGLVLGTKPLLHLCLLEEPWMVLGADVLGILAGFLSEFRFKKISYFSHGAHVFVASFASLSYLITFGAFQGFSTLYTILTLFVIATIAVVIPCCSSDIVMPLSFIGGIHGHEHEDEHTHA